MKTLKTIFAILMLALAGTARAALTESITRTLNLALPDDTESGIGDTIIFTNGILGTVPNSAWTQVRVRLQIAGGYNGDMYVLLEHGTNVAVLLNRPGRSAAMDAGYGDGGFNVTFDDTAFNGDVHNYRSQVNPLGGALTGLWRPDGRAVDPELCLDTDPRTALLAGLLDGDPDGEWSLTVIDTVSGDPATLVSWGLDFTYTAPAEIAIHDGATTGAPELTSGQVTPVNFGTTALNAPVSRDFTLANPGHDTLGITGISVPAGFLALGLPATPFNLSAGASLTFTALMTAESAGVIGGNLTVTNTDTDEGTFVFPVTGVVDGNAPVISTCATNRTLVMSGGASVTLANLTTEVSATDIEPGTLTVTQSPPAGTPLSAGNTTVVITVTDAAGNESTCQCVVSVVRLPVAGPDFGETTVNVPTAFRVTKLLNNDSDPDGAPLSITAVSPASSQGGVVSLAAGTVTYTPPAGFDGTDTFTYTLVAGSRQATGTVTVRVRPSDGIPSNLVFLRPAVSPATGMDMRFSGLPGRPYSVQFTQTLGSPWTELVRLNARAGSGFIDFNHAAAPEVSGFYRCLPAQ